MNLYQYRCNKRAGQLINDMLHAYIEQGTDTSTMMNEHFISFIRSSTYEQLKNILLLSDCDLSLSLEVIESILFNAERLHALKMLRDWVETEEQVTLKLLQKELEL
jgi:hypothetical protein